MYKNVFFFFFLLTIQSSVVADTFAKREFSFTLHEDIYLRYQSFKNQKQLEAEIKRLLPFKIDIGAVYNVR